MDSKNLGQVFDCFFQRAIISVSYSAADRLGQYAALNQQSPAFVSMVLIITFFAFACAPKFGPLSSGRNECLQTTLAILMSKLITTNALMPMEKEQTSYLILPTILFYLIFCAMLCTRVGTFLQNIHPYFKGQWDSVVPYVVIFCTSRILKVFQRQRQMHFLYFVVLFYPVYADALESCLFFQYAAYLHLFMESIISRGVVLIVEDYVFGKIHKADLALSFFYMCILVCAHFVLQQRPCSTKKEQPRGPLARQREVCLGVLMYSFSSHLLQAMQAYCNNQLITTFALTAVLLVLMLYQTSIFPASSTTEFCINSLSILWSGILDAWVFNFYHKWEPLFIYFLIFVLVQYLQDRISSILSITAAFSAQGSSKTKEIVLIATENDVMNDNGADPVGFDDGSNNNKNHEHRGGAAHHDAGDHHEQRGGAYHDTADHHDQRGAHSHHL